MERFSWQVHFRNRSIIRRDWRSVPVSGTIKMGRFRRFFVGTEFRQSRVVSRWSLVVRRRQVNDRS